MREEWWNKRFVRSLGCFADFTGLESRRENAVLLRSVDGRIGGGGGRSGGRSGQMVEKMVEIRVGSLVRGGRYRRSSREGGW